MDIQYKNNSIEFSFANVSNGELNKVINIINMFLNNTNNDISAEDIINIPIESVPIKKTDDRPAIRDRLPNEIDLSELKISKIGTEHSMIRCPKCGQSSFAIVVIKMDESYYVARRMNKENKEEFSVILKLNDVKEIKEICKPKNANIIDYFNDISKIHMKDNVDLNVNSDTLIRCPICMHEDSFQHWSDAFKYPLEFSFETETLCDLCGHEAVEVIRKDGAKEIQCEDCGFKKIVVK